MRRNIFEEDKHSPNGHRGEVSYYYLMHTEVEHLKELMIQHDKLTQLAIDKSEETLNERLAKVNEFREQQKDLISTFARQSDTLITFEGLSKRIELSIKMATDRYEANLRVQEEKIENIKNYFAEKMDLTKKTLEDKRETLYLTTQDNLKYLQERMESDINTGIEKFILSDRQTEMLIQANADISNDGLKSLYKSRDRQEGSQRVIIWLLGVIATIVVSLVIAFFSKHL